VNAANATAEVLTGQGCMRTGCSGHLCTEEGEQTVSTCQWKDEYACYKTARCEKQPDGNCGWTQSETLTTCLKSAAEKATGELKFAPQ
jgi:eight-cysteine-cluster-containing protein